MSYLDELNESQRKAVEHIQGPSMVIAGAGSGKTRVLTYRIAHLCKNGADPFQILALTFTNKAAKEMKERIATIIGYGEARNLWMGTFHSVFAKILRFEGNRLGYPNNFTIYDTQDSRSLIKSIIKAMNLDDKVYKPAGVHSRISGAKNNLIGPQAYAQNAEIKMADEQSNRPHIGKIYMAYAQRCFQAGAMDFDDLLFNTNVLFRDFPDVLHQYQHKFKYVLVDEYQDTNYSQYLIVRKLAAVNENLCVVGDDAQSIYSFRGANIQNILNFKRDYPDYALFKLEQNYRSTKVIVEAANSVISKNKDQIQKKVWTDNIEGEKIRVFRAMTDNEEGRIVASSIFETKMNEQAMDSHFAILYRTNAQSRSMEEALRKMNIPYKIFGGLSFYQRKEIKDLLAYFRLICNPKDEEAFKRIINYPARGIGQTTVDKVIVAAQTKRISLWEVACDPMNAELPVNKGTAMKLFNFVTLIKRYQTELATSNAYDLGYEVAKSTGLLKDLHKDKTPEGVARYENIEELLNGLKDFSAQRAETDQSDTLTEFLLDVALLTDADAEEEETDYVTLMTIHASKGLEFPYVYVVGMEENLFPSQMSLGSRTELEEERRLFYVAITRAEKRAHLSMANSRYRWGNLIYCEPSRFIEEIDPQFVEMPSNWDMQGDTGFGAPSFGLDSPRTYNAKPKKKYKPKDESSSGPNRVIPNNLKRVKGPGAAQSSSGTVDIEGIDVGTEVEHGRFGKGKVVAVDGIPPNTKATVFFPGHGKKQLLLKFAKLKVLT
jgi:DNA helicase-2/ATP-dependent DNA helicase PcrA